MKIGWNQVFEELEPPAGGLEALRHRIVEANLEELRFRRRARRARWAVAAAAAGLVVWVAVLGPRPFGEPAAPQWQALAAADGNPALVRLGLAAEQLEAVVVPAGQRHRIAVEKVDVPSPDVVFYRVAVLPGS